MQKQEAKHRQVQSQPAVRQEKGRAVESPYGQRIAQLSAMVGSSQQAVKQRQLAMLIGTSPAMTAQRQILEGMITSTTQRQEDEELLQGKFETTQRIEEEEPLQGKLSSSTPAQLKEESTAKTNTTGLPDNLKSGIESLSGMSLDNIKVHYNSAQPAQLNA